MTVQKILSPVGFVLTAGSPCQQVSNTQYDCETLMDAPEGRNCVILFESFTADVNTHDRKFSYLTALFLPKDGWWRVSFGATEEGHGATRSRDLVPRPHHHLRGHCDTRQERKTRYQGSKEMTQCAIHGVSVCGQCVCVC